VSSVRCRRACGTPEANGYQHDRVVDVSDTGQEIFAAALNIRAAAGNQAPISGPAGEQAGIPFGVASASERHLQQALNLRDVDQECQVKGHKKQDHGKETDGDEIFIPSSLNDLIPKQLVSRPAFS